MHGSQAVSAKSDDYKTVAQQYHRKLGKKNCSSQLNILISYIEFKNTPNIELGPQQLLLPFSSITVISLVYIHEQA